MPSKPLHALGRKVALGATEQFYSQLAYWGGKVPAANPKRHGVEVLRDIPYDSRSGAQHHHLDVYRPSERKAPLPVVFYIHGGGFRILSKDTHWVFGLGFARKGYIVFNVNYRLAPEHAFPSGAADVCRAYEWVAENAERFGGDPNQIVIAGESAGANLATMLTVATCSERPEEWARGVARSPAPVGVMPSCGLHQVSDSARFGRRKKLPRVVTVQLDRIEKDYLGDHPSAHMADPLLLLEEGVDLHRELPPFLITVGTRDPLLDDTRRLAAALDQLEVRCETRYYPGEGHAFQALVWRPRAKEWWGHSLRFLDEVAATP
jgi:acetyl esterase